jgi:2Fe-2S ferredoxin
MPKMFFVEQNGSRREVDAPLGLSVLEIAHKHGVDIEGACEGSLACSTCHVVVDAGWFGKLAKPTEDEEDMLDLAFDLQETSRLGCQIIMTEALDGLGGTAARRDAERPGVAREPLGHGVRRRGRTVPPVARRLRGGVGGLHLAPLRAGGCRAARSRSPRSGGILCRTTCSSSTSRGPRRWRW